VFSTPTATTDSRLVNQNSVNAIMSSQILTTENNKENVPENEEKKIPIFSVESILFLNFLFLHNNF
jgi:hypothetical protein